MNVKSANRENNQLKVVVTVEPEQFELGLNKAYLKNRKYIAVPGFRKGKAPRRMIENLYGKEVFLTDAVEEIFPEVFQAAVLDQGWKTVGQPSVTDMNVGEDNSLELTIETALYPEVTLGQYKGLEVPKTESVVTDEEVERELDKKAEEVSRIETVDRPAENGDTAVIDFEGFLDGVPFDGGKGEDYQLTLGSHSFIPGFEEQVVGMSANEEKEINVTFPEDYHAEELKGKPVVFKVKVHEVKKTIVPEKDDELAKDVSEFDTLDELRADLRANLLKQKEEENTRTFESAAVQMAVANLTVDVPAPMVDEQVEREMERFDSQLRQQGMSLEQYAKMFGGNLDSFKSSIRPGAENQVKTSLLLEAVAKAEGLEVSDEEAEEEYKNLSETYSMDLERVKSLVAADDIKEDLLRQKAHKLICESAVAVAPKAETEEAPASEE